MATETEKELANLRNRLRDLYEKSYNQNIFTFTSFLGLSELDEYYKLEREFFAVKPITFGGSSESDRRVVRFGNPEELGYEVEFPIVCIHIQPLIAKFADKLSHRDFLGALMNLGIERSTLGDIKVGDKEAYLFCLESIAEFICENLDQIKHTHVKCSLVANMQEIPEEEPERITVQVPSLRVDACISKVYNKSRNDCLELFRTGKVFVNGRCLENNSKTIKIGDTINARGYGKFKIVDEPRTTKKGKLSVEVDVYR